MSRDEKTKSWQDWVNPPYSIIAAGCNLNRDITQFVNSSPLQVVDLTEFENVRILQLFIRDLNSESLILP